MSDQDAVSPVARRAGAIGSYRRGVRIKAQPGVATAEMEDDVHHFQVALRHADGVITAVEAAAPRTPWVTCPGALMQLKTLGGLRLEDVKALSRSERFEHCLHLFDLALLAASRAQDAPFERVYRIDADHDAAQPLMRMWRDGIEILSWRVDNGRVQGSRYDGAALAELSRRLGELGADEAEAVLILRRASLISFVRTVDLDAVSSSNALRASPGATCYAKQPVRLDEAERAVGSSRDFWTQGTWPLEP